MKKLFIFLFVSILFACEKPLEINIPATTPKLVINAWLNTNQDIAVKIGRSRHVLDPLSSVGSNRENFTIKNAVAILYENDSPFDTLVFDATGYVYKSHYGKKIRQGFRYSIRVNAPDYNTAEGITEVPSQSEIAGIEWVQHVRTNSNGASVDEVTIRLNDPSERNFYMVQIFPSHVYGTGEAYPISCVSTTDKDIELAGSDTDPLDPDQCFDGGQLLLQDTYFNGSSKQIRLSIESSLLQLYSDPGANRLRRPYVKVYRITEEYFKFAKSYNVYAGSDENPFAEPVNVFSNIKNGYGIFSAYTVAVDSLRN